MADRSKKPFELRELKPYPRSVRWPRHKYPGMVYPKQEIRKKTWKIRYDKRKDKLKDPLTIREKQILYYIRMFQLNKRYSPTGSDIAFTFGFSKTAASYYVNRLVIKGFIEKTPGKQYDAHRSILFPKNLKVDWSDFSQFPHTVFPEADKIKKAQKANTPSPIPHENQN